MMMISNRISAAAARNRKVRALGFILIALLIGVSAVWRSPLSSIFWQILAPVMRARFVGDVALVDHSRIAAIEADRDSLYRDNLELKARLGRDAGVARILSGVLLRPPETPYDTLVIDAGSFEGVAGGDKVSAGGTIVIGTVGEVYTHSARVTLYSAPGERYDALLRTSDSLGTGITIPLAIEGQGGGSLRAQVPALTAVVVGDEAILPGIALGVSARVSHIERADGESFITIYFSIPVDIFTLRFVEVWKQHTYVTP